MPQFDSNLWQYIWGTLVLPLGWLWHRQNKQKEDHDDLKQHLNDHRIHVAENHFNKDEVAAIVDRTVKPIKESVDRIETSVNKLIDSKMKD